MALCGSSSAPVADVRSLRQRPAAVASQVPMVLSTGDREWLFAVHTAHQLHGTPQKMEAPVWACTQRSLTLGRDLGSSSANCQRPVV